MISVSVNNVSLVISQQIILKRPEWLGRVIIDSMLKRNYTSQILTDGLKSKINFSCKI